VIAVPKAPKKGTKAAKKSTKKAMPKKPKGGGY